MTPDLVPLASKPFYSRSENRVNRQPYARRLLFVGKLGITMGVMLSLAFFSRSFPMRPPHWLDGVIGDLRDVDDIALAIAEAPKFRQAIQQGIDAAFRWEGLHRARS